MANTISGTGSVVQNGSGTLVLEGPNSYQGGSTINSGTLKLGNATALGTGTLTINGCAIDSSVASLVLTPDNVQVWNSDFTFTGTNDLNLGAGAVSLGSTAGTRTVTVDANTLTVGGIISNGTATGLTKAGAGTLVLGGVNLYSGGTTVNAGTLTVNDGATLGASTGPLAVNNPNTGAGTDVVLNLNGSVTTGSLSGAIATPSSGTNTATINIAATKTLTVNQAVDGVYAGTIAGSNGALYKLGDGKLTLSGANTFTGGTRLDEGTLSINSLSDTGTSALGNSGSITVNGGTFQYTGSDVVSSSRFLLRSGNVTFDITQSDASLTINATYTGSNIIKKGAGTLALGGLVGWDHENQGQLALSVNEGTMVLGSNPTDPPYMTTINDVYDVKTGATLKLGNANGRQVRPQNTFQMSGGTFDLNGNTNNYEPQIDGTGTITNSNAAAASLMVYPSSIKTFSGNIENGTGVLGVQFTNLYGYGANPGAVWTLSGNNTYSGTTTVGVGTLKAGSTTAFSPSSAFTVNATLDLAGNNNQIAGLAGAGIVQSTGGPAVLTVNNDAATSNADYTFAGILQNGTGRLGLTKTGSKTLTLSGANTYSGATAVTDGTLQITGSALGTSGVTVAAPGVLELSNASASALAATTHVANDSTLRVTTSSQEAGIIDGLGTTDVTGGLTATSILQDTLSIGAGATVTIRPTTAGFGLGEASGVNQVNQVPEPSSFALLGTGIIGLLVCAWRWRKGTP